MVGIQAFPIWGWPIFRGYVSFREGIWLPKFCHKMPRVKKQKTSLCWEVGLDFLIKSSWNPVKLYTPEKQRAGSPEDQANSFGSHHFQVIQLGHVRDERWCWYKSIEKTTTKNTRPVYDFPKKYFLVFFGIPKIGLFHVPNNLRVVVQSLIKPRCFSVTWLPRPVVFGKPSRSLSTSSGRTIAPRVNEPSWDAIGRTWKD